MGHLYNIHGKLRHGMAFGLLFHIKGDVRNNDE